MTTRIQVRRGDTGSALVHGIFIAFVMAGLVATYAVISLGNSSALDSEEAIARARAASDEGIHRAIAELKSEVDTDGDGLGVINFAGTDDRLISVTVNNLGGDLWALKSTGSVARVSQTTEVIVEIVSLATGAFNPLAAITAKGAVATLGNINIDGRDHDPTGTVIVGPGGNGITAGGTITNGGSSSVGGNGIAPAGPAPAGTISPFVPYGDGLDSDGDGSIDEELINGLDDDGDGLVDEDLEPFPAGPDALFGLADGTFTAFAQAQGTYFTSEAQFEAYRSANGGNLPGGKIYVLDFDLLQPAQLGMESDADPSILIQHRPGASGKLKNVHGFFKGLMLVDNVVHFNADFLCVGAVISFGVGTAGSGDPLTLGNGNADILFSSAVLNGLPDPSGGGGQARMRSWRRAAQ